MLKSNLTRRAFVAGAAGVPVVALPARATDEDTELLALGVQLDRVAADWLRQQKIDLARLAEWKARLEAATGIPFDQRPQPVFPSQYESNPDLPGAAYWRTADQIFDELDKARGHNGRGPNGEDLGEQIWNEINDRMWPLVRHIVTFRPKTIAGLAIVAQAASLICAGQWDPLAQDETSCEREMVEAMCAFCGVIPMSEQVHV